MVHKEITVKHSAALSEIGLAALAGKNARIMELLDGENRINKGAMIMLSEPYDQEYFWYIPQESL